MQACLCIKFITDINDFFSYIQNNLLILAFAYTIGLPQSRWAINHPAHPTPTPLLTLEIIINMKKKLTLKM